MLLPYMEPNTTNQPTFSFGIIATLISLILLIVIGLFAYNKKTVPDSNESPKVAFAQFLKANGAQFYGSATCPHCMKTKAMFGRIGMKSLPYIECNEVYGTKESLKQCETEDKRGFETNYDAKDPLKKNLRGFPHWKFSDGSVLEGEQTLETLAAKVGYTLPIVSAPKESDIPKAKSDLNKDYPLGELD
jgi:hypothetical protein